MKLFGGRGGFALEPGIGGVLGCIVKRGGGGRPVVVSGLWDWATKGVFNLIFKPSGLDLHAL